MPTWKPNTLETIEEFLEKARRRLSDENPDYSDVDDEQDPEGLDSEFSEDEDDDAAKWLKEHDGDMASEEEPEPEGDDEAPVMEAQQPIVKPEQKAVKQSAPISENGLQPTREELNGLREYTRPWEQYARDRAKLEAEPHVNPIKHKQGHIVEARHTSHADRKKAYEEFTNTPEFQNADPITQMEMESKFHDDWHNKNPDHLMNAVNAHHEAHKKGSQAMQAFNQAKDEKIRHIAGGGVQPDAMSLEEGIQHAGGSRDDEDSAPSGVQQDKGAAFAAGNQEFMRQYMQNYEKRSKKFDANDPNQSAAMERMAPSDVLGDHPGSKNPDKKKKFDSFAARYYPLIERAGRQVANKLGLQEKIKSGEIDSGIFHEAGTHALAQAINDYDHDHPSKAKFTTHLNRKLQGLMQSALKAHDEIPSHLRAGAKKFDQARRAENAAPVKHTNKEGITTIINPATSKRSVTEIIQAHHPDVHDRLKRVAAARAPVVRKQAALQPKPVAPSGPKMNVRRISSDEGEE